MDNIWLIAIPLFLIAVSLAAVAIFLYQRRAPVFNLSFSAPENTFNVTFPAIPQADPVRVDVHVPDPIPAHFDVTFPPIPKSDPVYVEFKLPDMNVTFPPIPQPDPAHFNVTFPAIPQPDPIRVMLPAITVPPSTVVISHGVPGGVAETSGFSSTSALHVHAPMSPQEVEILKVDSSLPGGYSIVGRRPVGHPDIAVAMSDPKLAVRSSDGTITA